MTEQQLNEERVDVETEAPLKGIAVECVDAEAKADQIHDDILEIDGILEGAEVYLAEALQALTFPEVYGLEDPESRDKALEKLRKQIETVQHHMNRARELSEDLYFRLAAEA